MIKGYLWYNLLRYIIRGEKMLYSAQFSNIIYSILVIVFFSILRSFLHHIFHRRIEDVNVFFRVKRIISTIIFFLSVALLAYIWIENSGALPTYLGLFSAGVALAMKDILLNIAGFLYISIRQPFLVGHRIEIDGIKGDVIDNNLFKFRVLEVGNWVHAEQSTGRIIHIPNSKIFTDSLANYSIGFEYIWNEMRVLVTFESDWRKAKVILEEIIEKHAKDLEEDLQKKLYETSKKYMIYYNTFTPIVYTEVAESGVLLTMRFLCEPKKRRIHEDKIWEDVLDRYGEDSDIEIAYPTMRRIQK